MDLGQAPLEALSQADNEAILPLLSPAPIKRPHSEDSYTSLPVKHPHHGFSGHFAADASDKSKVADASCESVYRDIRERSGQDHPSYGKNSAMISADIAAFRLEEGSEIQSFEDDAELVAFRRIIQDRILSPEYDKQWTEDCQCFDALKVVKLAAEKVGLVSKVVLPSKTSHSRLLVFDLDNTLAHCSPSTEGAHYAISVTLPTGKTVSAGIRLRPFARECLQVASQFFEVAVFTASHSCYSDQVIDLLDPDHAYVQHRLFRENCLLLDSKYLIKDLRVIDNYDLKDIVIVENCILSYGLQLYNGVPVPTWNGEAGDTHLKVLMRYFRPLSTCPDVRDLNRHMFETYYCCLTDEDV